MQFRDYQLESINKTREALINGYKRPLIVAPTASGKSVIIAGLCKMVIEKKGRVLSLCHQGDILAQNERAVKMLGVTASTGIYCAGQGRKDTEADITFASRDSLANNPEICGKFDLIIVDEAHMISTNEKTQYQKIFNALSPDYIVGLTGSPWRLNNGLIYGEGKFFDCLSYKIEMSLLQERGFLSAYNFPESKTLIDRSLIRKNNAGDFVIESMNEQLLNERMIQTELDYWYALAGDRKTSIFFCSSIAHAEMVTEALAKKNVNTLYIDGNSKDRSQKLVKAKAGKYKAIVNVGVLTTGVDIPCIDCVVHLRPTESAALWVQMNGRGLRIAEGKKDCLILDFAGNVERFSQNIGSPIVFTQPNNINESSVPTDNSPTKDCRNCDELISRNARQCHYCGYVYIKTVSTPYGSLIDGWNKVRDYDIYETKTRSGFPCWKVVWLLDGARKNVMQWVLLDHDKIWVVKKNKRFVDKLQSGRVTDVKITDLNERFIKFVDYDVDIDDQPVTPIQAYDYTLN